MIKYIEDNKQLGIQYDFKAIKKEFKKLGIPNDVYNPLSLPLTQATYFMLLSERSTGKTTNLLLMGMIQHKMYGTIIHYLRSKETMVMNKNINDLFSTIRQFGYIEKLTEGKYNDVVYAARKWYYVKLSDTGEVIERSPNHFMFCMSIDKNEMYKSSYTCPVSDFIIFDEFISKYYPFNEFVYFMDLLKTLLRGRRSGKIFLLANTIDQHSEYFSEFEIYDEVQMLEYNSSEIYQTNLGTNIYVEFIADKKESESKKLLNRLYFGFNNSKINSIVGGQWSTSTYPHIERGFEVKYRGIYIDYHDKLLSIDIVQYEDIGLCLNVHRATRTYEDSIIYSLKEPQDRRYRYFMGKGDKLDKFLIMMIKSHKVRFQNNACGTIFFNHVGQKDANKIGY